MSRSTPVSTFVAVALLASISLAATLRGETKADRSTVASGPNAVAVSPEVKSRIAACLDRSSSGVRSVQECLSAIVKQRQQGNASDQEKLNEEHKTTYELGPQSRASLGVNATLNGSNGGRWSVGAKGDAGGGDGDGNAGKGDASIEFEMDIGASAGGETTE